MENTIRALNLTKECLEKYSLGDIKSMNKQELKLTCIKERADLVNNIFQLNTKNVINERLEIRKVNDQDRAQKRRDFLNSTFK